MNGYAVFPFVLTTLSAAGFSWPLVSRAAQLSPIVTSITYILGTAVAIGMGSRFFEFGPVPSKWSFTLGLIAGFINGLGMLAYSMLISNKEKWDMSTYLPLTVGLLTIFTTVGAMVFFNETANMANKLAGITAIIIGVYLLR